MGVMDTYYPLDDMQCRHGDDSRTCADCMLVEATFDDEAQYRGTESWEQLSNWIAR